MMVLRWRFSAFSGAACDTLVTRRRLPFTSRRQMSALNRNVSGVSAAAVGSPVGGGGGGGGSDRSSDRPSPPLSSLPRARSVGSLAHAAACAMKRKGTIARLAAVALVILLVAIETGRRVVASEPCDPVPADAPVAVILAGGVPSTTRTTTFISFHIRRYASSSSAICIFILEASSSSTPRGDAQTQRDSRRARRVSGASMGWVAPVASSRWFRRPRRP